MLWPPLTSAGSELSSLRSDIHSIESLLNDVLQRHALLLSRLDSLQQITPYSDEHLATADVPGTSDQHTPSWATVVKKEGRISLPLFAPEEETDDPIPLSNFFSPLTDLAQPAASCSPLPEEHSVPPRPSKKKHRTPPTKCSSPGNSPSGSRTSSPTGKRVRTASPSAPPGSVTSHSPSSSPAATAANTRIAGALVFPPPEFILLGDSMVRSVAIPKGIKYSFSGAQVLDLLLYAPTIIERHPSAHTVLLHCGVNDLRYRQ